MNYTDITLLIDRSGSMETIKTEMENEMKSFLEDQEKVEGKCNVSIYTFDKHTGKLDLDCLCSQTDIKTAKNKLVINPRGTTPLRDALSEVIDITGLRLSSMLEKDRPNRVLVIIITDGCENASTQVNKQKLAEKISHQESKYSWNFIYLGANQDSFNNTDIGLMSNKISNYEASSDGIKYMAASLSRSVSKLRTCSNTEYKLTTEGKQDVFN